MIDSCSKQSLLSIDSDVSFSIDSDSDVSFCFESELSSTNIVKLGSITSNKLPVEPIESLKR